MNEIELLKIPRVHFLAGKGGVGKSVLSKALASYFAGLGFKTLLVELSEEESLLGMRIVNAERQDENIWHLRIHPDQALFEYLSLKIASQKILNLLVSKNLFRALCSAMPGLSDLTRLGKIWFHADPQAFLAERPIFDKIVVDFPSSGFVKRFLSVAKVAEQAVRFGPLAKEASLMAKYFKDPAQARLHLVTLPEELSITETYELYKEIMESQDISLGLLFINRLMPFDIKEPMEAPPAVSALLDFFKARILGQEHELMRLKELKLSLPQVVVDEQLGPCNSTLILEQIKAQLQSGLCHD